MNIRCALYSTVTSAIRELVLHFTNTHSERRKYRKHFAFLTEVKGFILLLCRYNLHCLFELLFRLMQFRTQRDPTKGAAILFMLE